MGQNTGIAERPRERGELHEQLDRMRGLLREIGETLGVNEPTRDDAKNPEASGAMSKVNSHVHTLLWLNGYAEVIAKEAQGLRQALE